MSHRDWMGNERLDRTEILGKSPYFDRIHQALAGLGAARHLEPGHRPESGGLFDRQIMLRE